ncbi:hypothetical protein SAMN06298216_3701 [Spirosomataceae bacterium TFI 002]|nr:hypothetical protein SAMN06298216_3701 [Spirosomataceae bacterium TFI 002]
MKTQIDVIPFGGLGNRLRVLNSALYLSQKIGAKVSLGWIVKAELNTDFNNLYESATIPFERVGSFRMTLFHYFLKHIFVQKYTGVYKIILSLFYDLIIFDNEALNWSKEELIEKTTGSKKVLIATCYQFWDFPDYNNFVLTRDLKAKVESYSRSFENVIGVHVRRTDHIDIIKASSLNSYFEQMDKTLKESPERSFFICSDDAEVKKELKDKYGNKVFFNEIELSRASTVGMEGAILDIYLLAKTEKIIANSKSSFAVLASKIGKNKEIIEV